MLEDKKLIQKAQQKATGAAVHKIANYISCYTGAIYIHNLKPEPEDKQQWAAQAETFERLLRIFVATGRLEAIPR